MIQDSIRKLRQLSAKYSMENNSNWDSEILNSQFKISNYLPMLYALCLLDSEYWLLSPYFCTSYLSRYPRGVTTKEPWVKLRELPMMEEQSEHMFHTRMPGNPLSGQLKSSKTQQGNNVILPQE